ncbi:hypothetical protein ACXOST_09460, partial [Streptococcus thermophilus]
DGLVAFHYSSYGTFCVHSKSSIIPTVVLPTTEIIEPYLLTVVDDEKLISRCVFSTTLFELKV